MRFLVAGGVELHAAVAAGALHAQLYVAAAQIKFTRQFVATWREQASSELASQAVACVHYRPFFTLSRLP